MEFIYKVEDESVATKKLEESASEVSNSGAYPQQPIGVYTMKKFKNKRTKHHATKKRKDSPKSNQLVGATRCEKNMIKVLLESEPH